MQAIKLFVIFGAVLIMMGLGALVFKMSNPSSAPSGSSSKVVPMEEQLAIPSGARVSQLVGMDTHGVATLVELPQGGSQLLFFSSQGQLKRRISLTPVDQALSRSPDN